MALIMFNVFFDTLIIVLTLTFAFYKYLTWDFDYWSKRNVKFIKPTALVGNFAEVLSIKSSIGGYLADLYKQMSGLDYFGIWVFGTPHLVIRDPELIKHVLVKDFNHFSDRTITSDEKADPLLAHVIFIMKNPLWKTVRAKLTPIFTSGKIKNMVSLINEAGHEMTTYLNKRNFYDGIDVKELTAKFSTNMITSIAFGVNALSFEREDAAFRTIGRKMFNFTIEGAVRGISYFFAPAIVKTFKLTFFVKGVNEFCREAFWQAIEQRRKTGIKRNDVIDIIIEMLDSNEFEGDAAVAQAMQFFVAGFETTSSTISYTLYELAINEKYQTQLRKEIIETLNGEPEFTYEMMKKMEFMDQVIKETLRKYPILPFLDRRCVEEYKVPKSELVIEKGTPVYIPIYGLHHNEEYFPKPEVFDPNRFSKENLKNIKPYTYIPFGTGPRNCIGERFGLMATKLGIAHMLNNFYVEANTDTPQPIKFDPKNFVLQPLDGLPLNFIPLGRKLSLAG